MSMHYETMDDPQTRTYPLGGGIQPGHYGDIIPIYSKPQVLRSQRYAQPSMSSNGSVFWLVLLIFVFLLGCFLMT